MTLQDYLAAVKKIHNLYGSKSGPSHGQFWQSHVHLIVNSWPKYCLVIIIFRLISTTVKVNVLQKWPLTNPCKHHCITFYCKLFVRKTFENNIWLSFLLFVVFGGSQIFVYYFQKKRMTKNNSVFFSFRILYYIPIKIYYWKILTEKEMPLLFINKSNLIF